MKVIHVLRQVAFRIERGEQIPFAIVGVGGDARIGSVVGVSEGQQTPAFVVGIGGLLAQGIGLSQQVANAVIAVLYGLRMQRMQLGQFVIELVVGKRSRRVAQRVGHAEDVAVVVIRIRGRVSQPVGDDLKPAVNVMVVGDLLAEGVDGVDQPASRTAAAKKERFR